MLDILLEEDFLKAMMCFLQPFFRFGRTCFGWCLPCAILYLAFLVVSALLQTYGATAWHGNTKYRLSNGLITCWVVVVWLLTISSYFAVMLVDPGGVPRGWEPRNLSDLEYQQAVPRGAKNCKPCCQAQPDRAVHCAVCGRWVLSLRIITQTFRYPIAALT